MPSRRLNPKGAIPLRERIALVEEWQSFERDILAPMGVDPKSTQAIETRRAWYAGAAAIFALMTGGLDEDHEPTDLDVAYLEALNQELKHFSRMVGRGEA